MKRDATKPANVRSFVPCRNCGAPVILAGTGRPKVHHFCSAPECRKAAAVERVRIARAGKRLRPIDPPLPNEIGTVAGNNADLIAKAARLYLGEGAVVLDTTWGRGTFWNRFHGRSRRFHLIGSDIRRAEGASVQADFRRLPYRNACADVVVLDPPYSHDAEKSFGGRRYNFDTTKGLNHNAVIGRYVEGMTEAWRVLKPGGTLWVKCQDEIESGRQCRSHIEIWNHALALGFRDVDHGILVPTSRSTTRRWQTQKHFRKAHSDLWVFGK